MSTFSTFYGAVGASPVVRAALTAARSLNLPDSWLVGGFVRDVVWSSLTGRTDIPYGDLDLVFFDSNSTDREYDKALEQRLVPISGSRWSIKNQARMHVYNNDDPYESSADAMFKFPETLSAIGLRLDSSGTILATSCYGYDDLLSMSLRPTGHYLSRHSVSSYAARLERKRWLVKWPEAKLVVSVPTPPYARPSSS